MTEPFEPSGKCTSVLITTIHVPNTLAIHKVTAKGEYVTTDTSV